MEPLLLDPLGVQVRHRVSGYTEDMDVAGGDLVIAGGMREPTSGTPHGATTRASPPRHTTNTRSAPMTRFPAHTGEVGEADQREPRSCWTATGHNPMPA